MDDHAAAEALTQRQHFDHYVEVDGDQIPITVREPTLGELEEIEQGLPDDAEEIDAARRIIDRYLEAPAIDANDLPMGRAMALFYAMQEAWQQSDVFEQAREEMPVESGNG